MNRSVCLLIILTASQFALAFQSTFEGLDLNKQGVRETACKALIGQLRKDTNRRGVIMESMNNKVVTEEMMWDYVFIQNWIDWQNKEYVEYCILF
jgi:hypothetical protein